jgi:antibiotic biosynthesis monooxygenase (ABM) superfamily enzyme
MANNHTRQPGKSEQLKRTFIVWLAIFPLITVLIYVLEDYLVLLPLVARTFVLTLIAVPVTSYWLMPFYSRLFRNWLK